MSLIKLKIIYEIGRAYDYHCHHFIENILFVCSANQRGSFYVMARLACIDKVDEWLR